MKKAVINTNGVILDVYNDDETPYVPKNCEVVEISNAKASKVESNKPEKSCLVDNEIISMTEWFALRVSKVVPESVDTWKLKAILKIAGKTPVIESVIAGMSDDLMGISIQEGWKNAAIIQRHHPLVLAMINIPELDVTAEQMDEFFLATKQLD